MLRRGMPAGVVLGQRMVSCACGEDLDFFTELILGSALRSIDLMGRGLDPMDPEDRMQIVSR